MNYQLLIETLRKQRTETQQGIIAMNKVRRGTQEKFKFQWDALSEAMQKEKERLNDELRRAKRRKREAKTFEDYRQLFAADKESDENTSTIEKYIEWLKSEKEGAGETYICSFEHACAMATLCKIYSKGRAYQFFYELVM